MEKSEKKRTCWNYQEEVPFKMHGLEVVSATHPQKPNYSGHSRGRKIHLAKNETHTVCNMLIDEYCPSSTQSSSMVGNGKCGNCFNERAIAKVKNTKGN